jgi:hypothetical protein
MFQLVPILPLSRGQLFVPVTVTENSLLYAENPGSANFTLMQDPPHVASSTAIRQGAFESGPISRHSGKKTLTSMDHHAEGPGNIA